MRVIVDRVTTEPRTGNWAIELREILEEGDPLREAYRMKGDERVAFMETVGHERPVLLLRPRATLAARAAEYDIDQDDLHTLVDILICETYLSSEWWQTQSTLWTASSIEEARSAYLAEIARIKWAIRLNSRPVGKKPHPLDGMKAETFFHPADLAFRSMAVILRRHRIGVQPLDAHLATALSNMEKALAVHEDTDDSVSSEGYSS